MKKKMLAVSVAAVAAAGSAAAVDLPRVPAPYYYPPAPSIYNRAGFYIGLNLSYEWGKVTSSSVDPAGIPGGGQLGYNWQTGQFVFGAETDIQASSRRHFCTVEIFQLLVWHPARSSRVPLPVSPTANSKPKRSVSTKTNSLWLDCRAWNGSRLHAELVGQG
jgi:opacity protein-like surface antigen